MKIEDTRQDMDDIAKAAQVETAGKSVLDACCGSRMMWFDKRNPTAIFVDKRHETLTVTDRSHHADGTRTLRIERTEFDAIKAQAGDLLAVVMDLCYLTGQRIGDGTMIQQVKWSDAVLTLVQKAA